MRYKFTDDTRVRIILKLCMLDSGSKYMLSSLNNGPKQVRQHTVRENVKTALGFRYRMDET